MTSSSSANLALIIGSSVTRSPACARVSNVAPSDSPLVAAEVRGDDKGVAPHGVGCPLGDDLARLHAIDVVGDRQDQRKVVFDEDQRRVELLLHALDQGTERLGFALG